MCVRTFPFFSDTQAVPVFHSRSCDLSHMQQIHPKMSFSPDEVFRLVFFSAPGNGIIVSCVVVIFSDPSSSPLLRQTVTIDGTFQRFPQPTMRAFPLQRIRWFDCSGNKSQCLIKNALWSCYYFTIVKFKK